MSPLEDGSIVNVWRVVASFSNIPLLIIIFHVVKEATLCVDPAPRSQNNKIKSLKQVMASFSFEEEKREKFDDVNSW